MKIQDFKKRKQAGEKISFVTCYDYTSARIVNASHIDGVLVGDSCAMTMHGHRTTIPASVDMIVRHLQAVTRAIDTKFIVGDLPFLSYRRSLADSVEAVQRLMQAGAHAVKLEGEKGNVELINYLVSSGVPVMGHIGLTPQFVHGLGGYRVQGRSESLASSLVEQAQSLAQAGCFSMVLECVPIELAQRITNAVDIPTIGIGAGPHTDGQILVWQDMLGLQNEMPTKFVKRYVDGFGLMKEALNAYHTEVGEGIFPDLDKHSYD